MSNSPSVTFESCDGVGIIAFNRPKANAYDLTFHQEFNKAIEQADSESGPRAIVICSRVQGFFCAGADIKVFAKATTEENRRMVEAAREALARIEASGKPFIACIEGHALGGGLEIAMACDLRFAARGDYKLGLPEVKMGLIPGNGGTQRLLHLVGSSRALELLVTGDSIGPEEAHRLGLINQLFEPGETRDRAMGVAVKLAAGAPLAIAAAKRAVREGSALSLTDGLTLEARLVDDLYDTEDAKEGFKAVVEKRNIVYKGR
jgi:enoyl-CoA hydratase/carnithine racemase